MHLLLLFMNIFVIRSYNITILIKDTLRKSGPFENLHQIISSRFASKPHVNINESSCPGCASGTDATSSVYESAMITKNSYSDKNSGWIIGSQPSARRTSVHVPKLNMYLCSAYNVFQIIFSKPF